MFYFSFDRGDIGLSPFSFTNLSCVYSFPRLIIPIQDLKPCCGCDLFFITASTVRAVALPLLDGQLIIDRVSPLKRQMMKKEIRRLKRDGEW